MPGPRTTAQGRSLSDFGTLSHAEKTLLECCRLGETAFISATCPAGATVDNQVRGDFVRFLALGGDEKHPVHERGVWLQGACLTGELNLQAAEVQHPLWLQHCRIGRIDIRHARLILLDLTGCRLLDGLKGDRVYCEVEINLCDGFHATGEVRLVGASILGDLNCGAGRFENSFDRALFCDRAHVGGNVYLDYGFHALGEVSLRGAVIGNLLICDGGLFENSKGTALSCNGATVSGSAQLSDGLRTIGSVVLDNADIHRSLRLGGGMFHNRDGIALSLHGLMVRRGLYMQAARVEGAVSLALVRVGSFSDDRDCWRGSAGRLILDGFTYERLSDSAPTDAGSRIAWLDSQLPAHLEEEFRPQPWEQLITVLRAMGHPDEAREVAIAKQDRLRRAGKIAWGTGWLHRLYGLLVGYGYRPIRLLAATASVWILCAAAYWAGTNPQWFGAETHLLAPPPAEQRPAVTGRPARPADYANFIPIIYSADVLLPVVDLGYKKEWQPIVADDAGHPLLWGRLLRFVYWFEIAFGWVAGLLLVGVLGNLIKKD